MFEEYAHGLNLITLSLASIVVIFSIGVLFRLWKKRLEPAIKSMLFITFTLFALGNLFWAFGEIAFYLVPGPAGIPDIIYIPGYFFVIAAFYYFAAQMYKRYGELKRGIPYMLATAIVVGAAVYYLTANFIFGFQADETKFEMFLDYFYPIAAALVVVSSTTIYLFFKKLPALGKPLFHLALGTVISFVGDLLYTYYIWNDIYGYPGLISDFSYVISYGLFAYAFFEIFSSLKNK